MSLTILSFSLSTPPDQVKSQKDSPTYDQLAYDNLNLPRAGNQAIQKMKMTTALQTCHSPNSLVKEATNIYFITCVNQPILVHVPPLTTHSHLLVSFPLPSAETLPQAFPTLLPSHFTPIPGERGHLRTEHPSPPIRSALQPACCSLSSDQPLPSDGPPEQPG